MTLLKRLDTHIEDMRSRIGIDVAKSSMSTYIYTRRYLGEFIQQRFKTSDVAFGQLNEHIPWEFQDYILKDKGLAVDTARHYLAILKKNLPDGIQGRTCGEALFCEFQTTTREPETTTGFES